MILIFNRISLDIHHFQTGPPPVLRFRLITQRFSIRYLSLVHGLNYPAFIVPFLLKEFRFPIIVNITSTFYIFFHYDKVSIRKSHCTVILAVSIVINHFGAIVIWVTLIFYLSYFFDHGYVCGGQFICFFHLVV